MSLPLAGSAENQSTGNGSLDPTAVMNLTDSQRKQALKGYVEGNIDIAFKNESERGKFINIAHQILIGPGKMSVYSVEDDGSTREVIAGQLGMMAGYDMEMDAKGERLQDIMQMALQNPMDRPIGTLLPDIMLLDIDIESGIDGNQLAAYAQARFDHFTDKGTKFKMPHIIFYSGRRDYEVVEMFEKSTGQKFDKEEVGDMVHRIGPFLLMQKGIQKWEDIKRHFNNEALAFLKEELDRKEAA
jgi:hypothetical protein